MLCLLIMPWLLGVHACVSDMPDDPGAELSEGIDVVLTYLVPSIPERYLDSELLMTLVQERLLRSGGVRVHKGHGPLDAFWLGGTYRREESGLWRLEIHVQQPDERPHMAVAIGKPVEAVSRVVCESVGVGC